MPDENIEPVVPPEVEDKDVKTLYANAYRIFVAPEEVVVDFGFTMPNPAQGSAAAGQSPQMMMTVSDRVIMSFTNAKRLATSLTMLVRRYEQRFGEISLSGPQRKE
jgi:uncharacterized protein DUF3467